MGHHKKAVFISSTAEDLKEVRQAVIEAMRHTSYLDPVGMEYFGADPRSPQQMCEEKVRDCSIFLGIIGDRRGWEPDGDDKRRSITQIEYETALEENIPPFMAILPVGTIELDDGVDEAPEQKSRHLAFRTQLLSRHGCIVKFENKDKLAGQLVSSITNQLMTDLLNKQDVSTISEPLPQEIETGRRAAIEEAIEKATEQHLIDPEKILSGGEDIDDEALIEEFWQQAERSADKAVEYYKYVGALAFNNHTQKALEAFKCVVELAPDDPVAWNELGLIQIRRGDMKAAKFAFEKVLVIGNQAQNKNDIALAKGNLGLIFQIKGDLTQAQTHHHQSLLLFEELNWKEGIAIQLGNLGIIYYLKEDFEKSESYHRQSLALYEGLKNQEGVANQLGNLGTIYRDREDFQRAVDCYRQALKYYEELGIKVSIALQLGNLGIVYQFMGDLAGAEEYYFQALELNEQLGRKEGVAKQLGNIGSLFEQKGDLSAACQYFQQALDLFTEIGMQLEIEKTKKLMIEAGCEIHASYQNEE